MRSLKALLTKDVTSFFVRRFSSFTYLNVTQFLGALNDNIYKLLIVYFLIELNGIENSPRILSYTGATFVLPFLLFSASSGTLADRCSKRNIIVLTKLLELCIMIAGVFCFIYQSEIGSYGVLFLLATQSAIFGPSKYGIVPELVEEEKITKANGLMTSFTFLAIIIGTFCASFLVDITNRSFLFASLFCTGLSLIGLLTSFCIEYTAPSGLYKRFNILFISETYKALKMAYTVPSLLAAVLGSGFFLFLGAFLQLNMIPFAVQSLQLTDIQGGYLFLITALGIGIGSLLTGKISGKTVELGLVPLAGIGITLSCFTLDFFSDQLRVIIPLVCFVGILGGIYQVPLDSYILVASPNQSRGQIVAATNFISFLGVLFASGILYLISEVFHFSADKGFSIIGIITLTVTILIIFQFFDYLCRFIGMILSKLHFKTTCNGEDNIPDTPAIYLCTHTAWNDTLLILGAQRRRVRFFVEQEQDHKKLVKQLYKMLRIVNISSISAFKSDENCLEEIRATLKKGISVCIFVENADISKELEKLNRFNSFQNILKTDRIPIIPVHIEKGSKHKEPKFLKRFFERIHVTAEISFGNLIESPDPSFRLS